MEEYCYRSLDTQPPSFRLLKLRKGNTIKIECEIFHAVISDRNAISYEALSYAWGCVDLVESIEIAGRRLWITENLHSALQCLRSCEEDRVLWIDAVCINQSDAEERSQQVLEMGKIFGFATRVIFWLGNPTADAMFLMRCLAELETKNASLSHEGPKVDKATRKTLWSSIQMTRDGNTRNRPARLREGLKTLLGRPWFERVWIIQEIINARAAIVCSGVWSVSADFFASSPSLLDVDISSHVQAILDMMPRLNGGCKATDKRDMIFALLGMSSEPHNHRLLRPDYTKLVPSVIHNAVRYWIEETATTIRQVLRFLNNFETIQTTYLIPLKRITGQIEEIHVKSYDNVIQCPRDASLLLLEQLESGLSNEENPLHTELEQLQSHIQTGKLPNSSAFHIISLDNSPRNVKFLIILDTSRALLLSSIYGCRRVVNFTANSCAEGRQTPLNYALNLAVRENEANAVLMLLDEGADVNNTQDQGYESLLQLAVVKTQLEMVRLLLDNGAEINLQMKPHGTALQAALRSGKVEIVELLFDRGADINIQGNYNTALWAASGRGHVEVVKLLLDKGADVNKRGNDGIALHIASEKGHVEVVRLLLDRGADINKRGKNGTALHIALERSRFEVAKLLLDRGADINKRGKHGTALYTALEQRQFEVVKLLIDRGADVNKPGKNGTALHVALEKGHLEVAELLLDKGADANLDGGVWGSTLYTASRLNAIKVVRLLLDKGTDINEDGLHRTALHAASERGHFEVVKLLIDGGADVSQRGNHDTALHIALERGHLEVAELLLDNGADVNSKGGLHGTALEAAVWSGRTELVELLLDRGAAVNAPGANALQLASAGGKANTDMVRLLLNRGAEVTAAAVDAASSTGHSELVQILQEHGHKCQTASGP